MYDKTAVLTIDLATWNFGRTKGIPRLKNRGTGSMCCLGFECLLRGIPAAHITGISMPSSLTLCSREDLEGLVDVLVLNSEFSKAAALFNDLEYHLEPFEARAEWTDLNKEVKFKIREIMNGSRYLETEEVRQEIIKYLFKHYLDREVVFVAQL